jgi:hypothetical protein
MHIGKILTTLSGSSATTDLYNNLTPSYFQSRATVPLKVVGAFENFKNHQWLLSWNRSIQQHNF